jgi:hypothetical protein
LMILLILLTLLPDYLNHNASHDSSTEDCLIIVQNTVVVVVLIVWKPLVNAVDIFADPLFELFEQYPFWHFSTIGGHLERVRFRVRVTRLMSEIGLDGPPLSKHEVDENLEFSALAQRLERHDVRNTHGHVHDAAVTPVEEIRSHRQNHEFFDLMGNIFFGPKDGLHLVLLIDFCDRDNAVFCVACKCVI